MSKTKIFKNRVLVFGLLLTFLIAGCAGVETTEPVPTTPATEKVVEASPTPADTAAGPPTDTAQPTGNPTQAPSPTVEPTVTTPPRDTEEPPVETSQVDKQLTKEEMIAVVKADLASRLGISEGDIEVVSAEAVTWNDASLGCPEKGKMYAQVLTPGFQIILQAGGAEYDYHTDEYGHFVLCK